MNERIDQFLRVMRSACVQRPAGPNYRAADQWQADFHRDFPLATAAQQEWVRGEIQRACGVDGHHERARSD